MEACRSRSYTKARIIKALKINGPIYSPPPGFSGYPNGMVKSSYCNMEWPRDHYSKLVTSYNIPLSILFGLVLFATTLSLSAENLASLSISDAGINSQFSPRNAQKIHFDSQEVLWFATTEAIFRYDGRSLNAYSVKSTQGRSTPSTRTSTSGCSATRSSGSWCSGS